MMLRRVSMRGFQRSGGGRSRCSNGGDQHGGCYYQAHAGSPAGAVEEKQGEAGDGRRAVHMSSAQGGPAGSPGGPDAPAGNAGTNEILPHIGGPVPGADIGECETV